VRVLTAFLQHRIGQSTANRYNAHCRTLSNPFSGDVIMAKGNNSQKNDKKNKKKPKDDKKKPAK
jgi:hypothetical protein